MIFSYCLKQIDQSGQINSFGYCRKIFLKFFLNSKKTAALLRETEEISTSTNYFRHVWRQRERLDRAMTNAIKLSGTIHALLKKLSQVSMRIKRYFPLPLIQSNSLMCHKKKEEKKKAKKKEIVRDVEEHFLKFLGLLF